MPETVHTTPTSAISWRPDAVYFPAATVVPEALIMQTSTIAGSVEGDAPAVRIPVLNNVSEVGFVAEGAEIPLGSGDLDEVVVTTRKLATIAKLSREQADQVQASEIVARELTREIIRSADAAYIGHQASPKGLASGLTAAPVGADLDALVDAVASIESADGQVTHMVASPTSWATLSKLREATGSNKALLGAGVEAGVRQVLGVPVLVSNQLAADDLLLVDKSSVFSAVGDVRVDRSDDAFFTSDSVALRLTWRIGWVASNAARVKLLTTSAA